MSDDALRARQSAKWRAFGDAWPAWVAEMDVTLAEPITATLAAAVERSDTGYVFPGALPGALASYLRRAQGLDVPESRVIALADVLSGVAQSLAVLCPADPGVIITTPVYPPFFSTVRHVVRGRVVEVPLLRTDAGWAYDLEALDAAMARPDVHALLLSHPHNPTGLIADAAAMDAMARSAARHGVLIVSDEIHAPLVHPGVSFTSFLGIDAHGADVVVPLSATKAWNIPGLKCAQLVAGSDAIAARLAEGIPMEARYGGGNLGVLASIAAYESGQPWLDAVVRQIAANAAELAPMLAAALPDARYAVPDASYLAWIDLGAYGHDDPAGVVLERGRLAVNSGLPFGEPGRGCLRLNIGTAAHRLPRFVDAIAMSVRPA